MSEKTTSSGSARGGLGCLPHIAYACLKVAGIAVFAPWSWWWVLFPFPPLVIEVARRFWP